MGVAAIAFSSCNKDSVKEINNGDFNDLIEALMQKPVEELKELYNTREIEK